MVVINHPAPSTSGPSHTVVAIAVTASIVALVAIVLGGLYAIRRQRRNHRIELPSSPASIGEAKSRWSEEGAPTTASRSVAPRSLAQLGVPSALDDDTVVSPFTRPSSPSCTLPDLDALDELTRPSPSRFSFDES